MSGKPEIKRRNTKEGSEGKRSRGSGAGAGGAAKKPRTTATPPPSQQQSKKTNAGGRAKKEKESVPGTPSSDSQSMRDGSIGLDEEELRREMGDVEGEGEGEAAKEKALDVDGEGEEEDDDVNIVGEWASVVQMETMSSEDVQNLMKHFSGDQMDRFEAYRRSTFQRATVKRLVSQILNQQCSANLAIAVGGVAKVYVGEIVEQALEIMEEWNHTGPIRPEHLREAQRRYRKQHGEIGGSMCQKSMFVR